LSVSTTSAIRLNRDNHVRYKLLIIAALACALLSPAAADDPQRWTDPSGQISFAVSENGWEVVSRAEHPDWYQDEDVLIAVPDADDTPIRHTCLLSYLSQPAGGAPRSRERLNDATRALENSPTIQGMRDSPMFNFQGVSVNEVDGVAVLDVLGATGSLTGITRRFMMHSGDTLFMYTLTCSAEASDTAASAAALALANSLRISEVEATP
jgi:hypothetical protein